jgi:4,5-DOPA dioxygenase extradiol
MDRKRFLQTLGGVFAMGTIADLKAFSQELQTHSDIMPALFVGHGSPMNGIEENPFSAQWELAGKSLPAPKAVLVISAHWYTRGTRVTAVPNPETIYDFHGFPPSLYQVKYRAPGDPQLANDTVSIVKKTTVELDHEWGLDHGAWTVVRRMYPEAKIPVLQFSIDYTKGPQYHYELGAELNALRSKGVLILGSGNMVHNLRMLDWQNPSNGYDWAVEMNETFKRLIATDDHKSLIDYEKLGTPAKLSIPTPEHYLPLLYLLGMKGKNEAVSFFNDNTVMGSVSMTSVKIG